MAESLCPRCGNPLPPSLGTKPRKWCSESCRVQTWQERTGRYSRPLVCAASFPTCVACGTIFAARAGGRRRKRTTCSEPCHRIENARYSAERHAKLPADIKRASRARRRAILAGAEAEVFPHLEIFECDDWICGICHEKVDSTLRYPDRMSVSLDHIVPISRGGQHKRANVRCSHLICNITRGNRLDIPA